MRWLPTLRGAVGLTGLRLALPLWVRLSPLTSILRGLDTLGLGLAGDDRALRWVELVLDRVPLLPRTCLYRSLSRYAVLRGAGRPAVFVMAVRRGTGGAIEGHAWIEIDGRPFREPPLAAGYAVTLRHPPADPLEAASQPRANRST